MRPIPAVKTIPDVTGLQGGLDLITPPVQASPGLLRFGLNYEAVIEGGYERLGGYERFDGQARPSDATYGVSVPAVAYSGVVAGNTVTGGTSGVTAVVIAVVAAVGLIPQYLVLTKLSGAFTAGENLLVSAVVIGVHSSTLPAVTAVQDNTYFALAAAQYRPAILQVPGAGPTRGVAILNSVIYAWRNVTGNTAMAIYKSTVAGWVLVPLYYEISFTAGSTEYAEGSTLSKGGVTATVKRSVLETGSYDGGTGAGRLIITAPAGGSFTAGVAAGGGVVTLSGAEAQITLAPNGRVESYVTNFLGSAGTKRLYGCDGVNREFEFDGDVLVPINTGMASIRASHVIAHKNQLLFAYKGSVQNSGITSPYQWLPLFGAAELGTGDTITGFMQAGGSEVDSALYVFCQDSVHILYGNNSSDWDLKKISDEAGANAYSVQDIGSAMTHDTPGFRNYNTTQAFGNFQWEVASRLIDALAKEQHPIFSVYVKSKSRYRCFMTDGSCIGCTPSRSKPNALTGTASTTFQWVALNYGRNFLVGVSAEVAGITRTFYGDDNGWIVEADVGRSFDGAVIDYSGKTTFQHQKSPMVIKQYRRLQLEASGFGAFTLNVGAEFSEGDPDVAPTEVVSFQQLTNFGHAMVYSGENWSQASWDVGEFSAKRLQLQGQGTSVATLFGGSSAIELPHQLKSLMWQYTPLRGAI